MSGNPTASVATLLVATPAQTVKLPKASTSGLYPGHVDPFYNVQCDLLPGPEQVAFEEEVRRTGGDWPKSYAELATQRVGDTPFAVLALRDGVVVGWLRFYRAASCKGRAFVAKHPATAKALVIGAASARSEELSHGTARQMIEEAARQAKRLRLKEIYAIASPDIRAYSAWCNQFMLKDYAACGFEVIEKTPADDSALGDMLKGAHGKQVQDSVREDGVRDAQKTTYCLVRRKCE